MVEGAKSLGKEGSRKGWLSDGEKGRTLVGFFAGRGAGLLDLLGDLIAEISVAHVNIGILHIGEIAEKEESSAKSEGIESKGQVENGKQGAREKERG